MRKLILGCSIAALLFVGCNGARKPNETNFKKAINAYMAKHGRECVVISHPLPFDVATDQKSIDPGPAALEQVGLLHSSEITVPSSFGPAVPARHYVITELGKKYLGETQNSVLVGNRTNFCYAQVAVHAIHGWTEPATSADITYSAVKYTYQLDNLAPWAKAPVIQTAFPFLKNEIEQAETKERQLGVILSSSGWSVE
jgi:hypothetical protein